MTDPRNEERAAAEAGAREEKAAPTPGPWTVDDGDSPIWGVFDVNGSAICYLAEPSATLEPLQFGADTANARLLASAPSLLAALKAVKSILWMAERYAEGDGSHGIEMEEYRAAEEQIRWALAQAEGGPE